MIHLMTTAHLFPSLCFVARCGYSSDRIADFGKVKHWEKTSLEGITCPLCCKEIAVISLN